MMNKNYISQNSINFHKLIATLLIALLHFFNKANLNVAGWAIFVDFFFTVSGLLLAITFERKQVSTKLYIIGRYRKIWPHFIFGYVVYFAMLFIRFWPDIDLWGGILIHSFLEAFLLQIFGINEFATNHGAVWYLSVLMVCSAILYFILGTRIKEIYIRYIGPFIAIGILLLNKLKFGTEIMGWNSSHSFIGNPAFWRGLYGMTAGILIYYVSKYYNVLFEKINRNFVLNALLQIFECILLLFVIIGSVLKVDTLIMIVIIWGIVFLSWNLKHFTWLRNNFYDRVSVLFLPVYINHALFADTRIMLRLPFSLLIQTLLYLIVVVIYSYISYRFVNNIFGKITGMVSKK